MDAINKPNVPQSRCSVNTCNPGSPFLPSFLLSPSPLSIPSSLSPYHSTFFPFSVLPSFNPLLPPSSPPPPSLLLPSLPLPPSPPSLQVRLQTQPKPAPGEKPMFTGTFNCAYKTVKNEVRCVVGQKGDLWGRVN